MTTHVYAEGEAVKVRTFGGEVDGVVCEMDDASFPSVVVRVRRKRRTVAREDVRPAERPARKFQAPRVVHDDAVPLTDKHVRFLRDQADGMRPLSPHPKARKAGRSAAFLAWIRLKPCAWCSAPGPSDPDHFGARGVGQRCSDFRTVPLCRPCHQARTDTNRLPGSGPTVDVTRLFMERTQLDLVVLWLETKGGR